MTEEKMNRFLSFCMKRGFDISNEDSRQRKAVLSNRYSVLPSGAGSGKTTVLTYRFLRLVADDEGEKIHSDEILTITFTKAATANMRAKIYLILKDAEKEGLISDEEIRRFSNAEISTTDSFCSKIVRSDAIRYGLTPSFRIEDDDDLKETVSSLLKKIVEEKIESEKSVEAIFTCFSFDEVVNGFIDYTYNIFNPASPINGDEEEIYRTIKEETKDRIKDALEKEKEKIISLLDEFKRLFLHYSSLEKDLIHIENIRRYLLFGEEITSKFSPLKTIKENKDDYPLYKEMKDKIKKELAFYTDSLKYLSDESFSLLKGYASILYEFQKRMLLHKRETGLLTFHDVMLLSIDILKTNPSLRAYYNRKFKRIMVDEFQDNNEENKRLIYLLSAEESFKERDRFPLVSEIDIDKVFMVGDEKQSIYRFRGADVSVFKNINRDFGDERVLALTENYRSEKSLIDKINKIFDGTIMTRHGDECRDFEAEYTPLASHKENVASSISFRYMNINSERNKKLDENLLSSNPLSEAYEVARIIKEEILGNEKENYKVYDRREGGLRTPKAEDIAILLRKTTNQSAFEKALRLFDIPFSVSDNKSLTAESTVNDFYSILQYSIYGDDDLLSYLSTLRSPFINLQDNDIVTVLDNIKEGKDKRDGVTDEGKLLLSHMDSLMEKLKEKEKRESLTSIMDYLWFDTGYRFYIESRSEMESYREHYDYLFSIASDFDSSSKGMVDLLDTLRPTLGKSSSFKDINILSEEKKGVTIQTIHKSKGLEYPIVFLSDMAGTSNNESFVVSALPSGKPLFPYYRVDNYKLINPLGKVTKSEESMIENAETKRILYVAATRSEHHLIFTSVFNKKMFTPDGFLRPTSPTSYNSMLQYLIDGIDFTLENKSRIIEVREFNPVYYSVFRKKKRECVRRDVSSWYEEKRELPVRKEKNKIGVTSLIKEDEESERDGIRLKRFPSDDILASSDSPSTREERITEFGTLVHLLLEDAVNNSQSDTSLFFKDERKRDVIFDSAFEMRDNFLNSSFYKSLGGYKLYTEKEILIKDGDNIVEGVIDLMCVNGDKIIIVDYKTDSTASPEKHRAQLSYYRKALSTIYEGKKIETYLFYLRSGSEVLLKDD